MLVTLLTPSYNQAAFLEATIRSVLAQDYADIEYLIVDGGSTDGSVEIIRHYADRLAWWTSEPDQGQADAIRKGFARANGQVLAWLNSDDLLAPTAVREAVEALQAHPGAGFVYGDAASIDGNGNPLNDMVFRQYTLADLAAFHIICQPAVFMHRSAYEAAGGVDPDYQFLMDHQLWLRIAAQRPIVHAPKVWAFPRQHPEAKNVAQAGKFGEEARKIVEWMGAEPDFQPVLAENERQIRAASLRFDARYLLDGGQAGPALQKYLRALTVHPPTALVEWHRMVFAGLSMLGLGGLGKLYYRARHGRISESANQRLQSLTR